MKEIGYYNGELGPLSEMKVPMLDRALYFGDGVYDVATANAHQIFSLEDHLDRFYHSMELLQIHFHLSKEELTKELTRCMEAAESDGGLILYWQASRGVAKRNHAFPKAVTPSLTIMVTEFKPVDYTNPLKLLSVEDTRFYHCNIKTLNLIPNCVAFEQAVEADCQEAVFHRGDLLTECAHSSLLILKDGTLIGPVLNELILPSISRKHLFELAEELGIPCGQRDITMEEVFAADEVIVSSTTKMCARANTLDEKPVGMKDLDTFDRLQKAYFKRMFDEVGYVASK